MNLYLTDEDKERIRKLKVLKAKDIANFLKVSPSTVLRLLKRNLLKYSHFKLYKRKVYLISADEFISFMEKLTVISNEEK